MVQVAAGALCIHECGRVADKWRGLCSTCYYLPGVRKRYPTKRTDAYDLELGEVEGKPPTVATRALPGSEEKVRILEQRVLRGEQLWHPQDVTLFTARTDECNRDRVEPGGAREPYGFRKLHPSAETIRTRTRKKQPAPLVEEPAIIVWPREERTGQLLLFVEALLWRVRRGLVRRRW